MEDYIDLIHQVLGPKAYPECYVAPTLTYGLKGYEFAGEVFGENRVAAEKARAMYWGNDSSIHPDWELPSAPQGPLTPDVELEPLEP